MVVSDGMVDTLIYICILTGIGNFGSLLSCSHFTYLAVCLAYRSLVDRFALLHLIILVVEIVKFATGLVVHSCYQV